VEIKKTMNQPQNLGKNDSWVLTPGFFQSFFLGWFVVIRDHESTQNGEIRGLKDLGISL